MSNKREKNLLENEQCILKAKREITKDYFTKNEIEFNIDEKYKSILFKCPICKNDEFNLLLNLKTFTVFEKEGNTCSEKGHDKKWKKIKSDLKSIWDNSKEKENVVFSLNVEYIKKIIESRFPKIIRQKNTKILFRYDEEKQCYIEMVDNTEVSDIEDIIYDSFFDENNSYLSCNDVRDIKNIIKKNYKFECKNFEFSNLLNCKNGVLDIKNKKLYPHSDKYFFNYRSDINYNPNADSRILDNFIKSVVTEENPIELIKRILGHIHYQGEKLQKGFLFKGTKKGRNGKGTLVKLISKVIGKHRTVTISLPQIESSDFTTYNLKDKSLLIEDDFKLDYLSPKIIGFLNRLISGADELVHQKNKPQFQIEHTAIPIIQCNKVPKLKAEDDGGFYLRFVIVNFENEYGDSSKNDEFLGSRLLSDENTLSSLLNYLIDGYNQIIYRKNNSIKGSFFKNDEVSHISEWKRTNNSVLQFIHECCNIDKDFKCSTRKLWRYYYNNWNLKGSKLSERKFVCIIKEELNIETKREIINDKKTTMAIGLGCEELEKINDNYFDL